MDFTENDIFVLLELLEDYADDSPEYLSARDKLLCARKSPQTFTVPEVRLMVECIGAYYDDSGEALTSPGAHALGYAASVLQQREQLHYLRKRLRRLLPD